MEHPQPYSDTDPRAMEVWLDLLRKMPASKKLDPYSHSTALAIELSEAGVRMAVIPRPTTVRYFSVQPPGVSAPDFMETGIRMGPKRQ